MKVKLIKVELFHDRPSYYSEDFEDVKRHIVSENSQWEEISDNDIYYLEQFISTKNAQNKNFYYALIKEDQPTSVNMLIAEMKEKAEQEEKKRKEKEERYKIQQAKNNAERAAKKKARLEKQLEKLKQELNEGS